MYVYKLQIKTNRRQEKVMWRIHVVLVKHAQKLIRIMKRNRMYQDAAMGYKTACETIDILEKELDRTRKARKNKKLSRKEKMKYRRVQDIQADIQAAKADKAMFAEAMNTVRESIGLTESGLQGYVKVQQHKYAEHLQSQEVQKEASRVWDGVEKVLFGNGRKLKIPKLNDIRSICGKQKGTGIRFILGEGKVLWNGLDLKCDMKAFDGHILPRNAYETVALGEDFSYCEIVRLPFPEGCRYYLHVYMRGEAPDATPAAPVKDNGIDPGVSTMASVSEDGRCALEELAPDIKKYNRIIQKLNNRLEEERRRSNPGNYLPDGRIRRGRKVWIRTEKYNRIEMKLRSWYRKRSGYVKTAHGTLANQIIRNGSRILVERMRYSALAKRSRKTDRQDKESTITKKDGTSQQIRKYKKKKRFGRSLNNRSPALFLQILKKKAVSVGGSYAEVDTRKLCASQYDHTQGKNIRVKLNCRMKEVGGHKVQRDLYSAFIVVNVKEDLSTPDREKCNSRFASFLKEHDKLINEIKSKKQVRPACFGF